MRDLFVAVFGGLFVCLIWLVTMVFITALLAVPVYLLWNLVIPGLFVTLPEITFLQAWGLSLLCSCLFKTHVTTTDTK